jgi:hypothetical protein
MSSVPPPTSNSSYQAQERRRAREAWLKEFGDKILLKEGLGPIKKGKPLHNETVLVDAHMYQLLEQFVTLAGELSEHFERSAAPTSAPRRYVSYVETLREIEVLLERDYDPGAGRAIAGLLRLQDSLGE